MAAAKCDDDTVKLRHDFFNDESEEETDKNKEKTPFFPVLEPTVAVSVKAEPDSICEIYAKGQRPTWMKQKYFAEFKEKKNLDIVLVLDDGSVKVHKSVICKYFECFFKMFARNPIGYFVIRIFNVNLEAAEATLDYLYFGEATIKYRSLPNMLNFIKCLQDPTCYTENRVKMYFQIGEEEAREFKLPPPPPPEPKRRYIGAGRGRDGRGKGRNVTGLERGRQIMADLQRKANRLSIAEDASGNADEAQPDLLVSSSEEEEKEMEAKAEDQGTEKQTKE